MSLLYYSNPSSYKEGFVPKIGAYYYINKHENGFTEKVKVYVKNISDDKKSVMISHYESGKEMIVDTSLFAEENQIFDLDDFGMFIFYMAAIIFASIFFAFC